MAAGVLLAAGQHRSLPSTPPVDMAVAPNFERFTGTHPNLDNAPQNAKVQGSPNKPGGYYEGEQVYTRGRTGGLTNVLGGEPLPVSDRIHRPAGVTQLVNAPTIQLRLGVGQHGPSSLGLAQTVALATITNNPPAGADILSIISGRA